MARNSGGVWYRLFYVEPSMDYQQRIELLLQRRAKSIMCCVCMMMVKIGQSFFFGWCAARQPH